MMNRSIANLIFLCWLLLALKTIVGVEGRDQSTLWPMNCTWKKKDPKACNATISSYKIDVSFAPERMGSRGRKGLEETLGGPIAAAVDHWLSIVLARPSQTRPPETIEVTQQLQSRCGGIFLKHSVGTHLIESFDLLLCFRLTESVQLAATQILLQDSNSQLPRIAQIKVNPDKLPPRYNECAWANIMLHEIGHALGFAQNIAPFCRLTELDSEANRAYFIGTNATREWRVLSKQANCPPSFGFPYFESNTDMSHWPGSHGLLQHSVMVPSIHSRSYDPYGKKNERAMVSRVTVGVLADLGYRVNYYCADDLGADTDSSCTSSPPSPSSSSSKDQRNHERRLSGWWRKANRKRRMLFRSFRKRLTQTRWVRSIRNSRRRLARTRLVRSMRKLWRHPVAKFKHLCQKEPEFDSQWECRRIGLTFYC